MCDDFIPTRGSTARNRSATELEVVTFESHKPKLKKVENETDEPKRSENIENVFDIRKAKHEIIKFGINGLTGQEKSQAKMQLAIKLGAKPPKKKAKNYKELIMERKIEKRKVQESEQFQQLGKNKQGKSIAKGKSFDRKRKKIKTDGILGVYGKVKSNLKK